MIGLALYKLIFITELLIAEGLFAFRMEKRKLFPLRLIFSLAVCYLAAYFYPLSANSYSGWMSSLMFLVLFFTTLFGLLFSFKIPFKKAAFCAVAAYTAQHLAYEIFKLVCIPFNVLVAKDLYGSGMISFSEIDSTAIIAGLAFFDIYLAVYTIAYFIIGKKLWNKDVEIKNTNLFIISVVILLVDIILNAFIIYIDEAYNTVYDVVVGVYNALCCTLVFYIQRNLIYVKDIENELKIISHILQQAKTQYQIKKEEIDLINIKCHDLKHQVSNYALQGGMDNAAVAEIKQMISIYDATVKTGNEVLDIIFTEKSLLCQSKKIRLTVMADCSELGFISDGELYALFGNILDNAIEASAQVQNEDNRCIDVNIRNTSGFISVMAENYYEREIRINDDGTPITQKEDKDNHGFGFKSIVLIVKKYGGNVSFDTDDGIFRLNILLPIPAAEKTTEKQDMRTPPPSNNRRRNLPKSKSSIK